MGPFVSCLPQGSGNASQQEEIDLKTTVWKKTTLTLLVSYLNLHQQHRFMGKLVKCGPKIMGAVRIRESGHIPVFLFLRTWGLTRNGCS